MKKITLIVAIALSTFACNQLKDNEFIISGEAAGLENGKKVFVEISTPKSP